MFRKREAAPAPGEPATVEPPETETQPVATTLNKYVGGAPSAQHALDLFDHGWASSLPPVFGLVAGEVPLFEDPRIRKVLNHLDSIKSFKVLELGPFEAGHTYMLHEGGSRVVAIEGHAESYLKCLVVKEILNLNRAHFFLGDFNPFLQTTNERFDLVVASGVLYESSDPVTLLESIARVTDKVAIWTHYWDRAGVEADPEAAACFGEAVVTQSWRDRQLHMHPRGLHDPSARPAFCADPNGRALWMERDELIMVLRDLGFERVTVLEDESGRAKGPAVLLCAER